MFALTKPEDRWIELIPARDDAPAVRVKLPAQPSPIGLRKAQLAVTSEMRGDKVDRVEFAGDAFSRALIRYSILAWEGIGDADGEPVLPTHDRDVLDEEDKPTGEVELGTISHFLAEPRFMQVLDREWVLPWTQADARKNGFAGSSNGTSPEATPAPATAISPATSDEPASAATSATTARSSRKASGKTRLGRRSKGADRS